MDNGRVLFASHDGIHVLRLVGDIRYTLSPSFDRFLQGLLAGPTPAGFVIDLTETHIIDSTNLGLLARIAKHMRGHGGRRVTIVSDREDINELLRNLGFDEIFDLVERSEMESEPGDTLRMETAQRDDLYQTVLNAHRTLMALNARNEELFRDVVTALEKQVGGD